MDNSIISYEYRVHQPFGSQSFNNSDEVRITIPEVDNFTVPGESYNYVEGRMNLVNDDGTVQTATKNIDGSIKRVPKTTKFICNPIAFLFSDIRYILNGVQVDSVRNVSLSFLMKGYFSYTPNDMIRLRNAGWNIDDVYTSDIVDSMGNFSVCVPLKSLCSFAEDYTKIILYARQELVLIRSNDDTDAMVSKVLSNVKKEEKVHITIEKIVWRLSHVNVGLREQLLLTKLAEKNTEIQLPLRSWEMNEYSSLPETTKHSWSVKTATQTETPRFIIIGFQTNRKGKMKKNMTNFDKINLTNLTVFLNGERFPYDNLNIDYKNNHYAILYEMFARFQEWYYGVVDSELAFKLSQFKENIPLIGIDFSHQKDVLHKSGVEIRIEFTTSENVPKDTAAYCLILHHRAF